MATFLQLQTSLADWLSVDATRLPVPVRKDLLNQAMRELCHLHELRFNEFTDTFATVIGTQAYALPTGFSRPYLFWYLDTATKAKTEVKYLEPDVFIDRYPDSTKTGDPNRYTIWGSNFKLAPTPKSVRTINREYYRIPPDLSADGDTNSFTTDFWEPILFRALVLASKYGFEDARAPLWEAEARKHEQRLITEYAGVRSHGLKPVCQAPG